MSTATASTGAHPATGDRSLTSLGWIEARRFARHPLFLVGAALLVWLTATGAGDAGADTMSAGFFPAFLVGVFGCVVAYRLTRSTESSAEAMDCAPVPLPRRTAALCLACLVPATFVAVWSAWLVISLQIWPAEAWMYGGFAGVEQVIVLVGTTILACLGGPLLGVAAGRWLRFPGGGVLVAAGLVAITMLTFVGRSTAHPDALWATAVRLLAPYQFFTESSGLDVQTWVMRYPGSPFGYVVWQLALCGLAAVAAMLYGSGGASRTRLLRLGAVLALVGILGYAVAVFAGPSQSAVHLDDGTVTVGPSLPAGG